MEPIESEKDDGKENLIDRKIITVEQRFLEVRVLKFNVIQHTKIFSCTLIWHDIFCKWTFII